MFPLTVSPEACRHLLALAAQDGRTSIGLTVTNKGCGGHTFMLTDGAELSADTVALSSTVNLVIDAKAALWAYGLEIDYIDEGLSRRMVFNSAQHKSCGCGVSFSAPGV
jgi:iron-sulfur cluster assembly accessory protein